MSKLKPFLFGCCVGAGCVFVALQYHLVRSHDGFQFVPRTPQHSLGLAVADVREWDAAQWMDRPELARALVAHGSSDLIASSVAGNLADAVTADNSTLEQLRSYLNEAPSETPVADDLLSDPIFSTPAGGTKTEAAQELFRVPFPDSTQRIQPLQQLSQQPAADDRLSVARTEGLSAADVFDQPTVARPSHGQTGSPAGDRQHRQQETGALEQMLFDSDAADGTPAATSPEADSGGLFQDVTSALDRRAADALARARSGFFDEMDAGVSDGRQAIDGYVRDKAAELVPESAETMFSESPANSAVEAFSRTESATGGGQVPYAEKARQQGFDPFLTR